MYPVTVFTTKTIVQDRYDYISCSTSRINLDPNTECVVLGTSRNPVTGVISLVVRPTKLTVRLKLAPGEYKEKL